MEKLFFRTWDPLTGCQNGAYLYRQSRWIRRWGGIRDKYYYMCLDGGETGEFRIVDEPFRDLFYKSEVGFPYRFDPTYCRYRLRRVFELRQPSNIAVCHKGDLFAPCVPDEVICEVMNAAAHKPIHHYFFLTRYPQRYQDFPPPSPNFIYGVWIDRQRQLQMLADAGIPGIRYLVMEPMRKPIDLEWYLRNAPEKPEWILLGTGRLKYRKLIQPDWIREIADVCRRHSIPLYMKNPLRSLAEGCFSQQLNQNLFL